MRRLFIAAVSLLAGQPALAANDLGAIAATERRSALFAGAGLSLPLGGRAPTRPTARLQFGATHAYRGAHAATAPRAFRSAGLELGVTRRGAAALSFAGQEMGDIRGRLGLSSTGTVLAVVGGAAAIALIAVAAGGGDGDDGIEEAPPPRPVP